MCRHYALNIPVAECEALIALYTGTNGASWTNKTNWLTVPNIDTWHGIFTSQYSDLIAHYTFDASNGANDAGTGTTATINP